MKIEPVSLVGEYVTLDPLCIEHVPELCEFGFDELLWRWTINKITNFDEMSSYIQTALNEQERGKSLPFVTRENKDGKIVGCTRFGNIDVHSRTAEIGWTWVDPERQRTFVNTEAKLLMLTHAFEIWECIRVALKTDALNEKSRNAILRIGAKQEGILRHHMITDSGRFRDTVYFSIIDTEWQAVKKTLLEKLRSYK